MVREELVYQDAVRLGLDKDPAYREKLLEAEAQLRLFQREQLSALYRRYVNDHLTVTDAEASTYFKENSERFRTQIHVWQITQKGPRGPIERDYRDLKAGTPFEEVAARRFPKLPEGTKAPWDMGYLHWNQIPEAWSQTLDRLRPGESSDIIEGENNRRWIIRLIARSIDPAITFETERGRIVAVLKRQKADRLYDDMLRQAKARADIVVSK